MHGSSAQGAHDNGLPQTRQAPLSAIEKSNSTPDMRRFDDTHRGDGREDDQTADRYAGGTDSNYRLDGRW